MPRAIFPATFSTFRGSNRKNFELASLDTDGVSLSAEEMYASVAASDAAYDGRFYTGVLTTKIYCLPSCPARTPKRENVRFYDSPEACEADGLRACLRCKPREWGERDDLTLLEASVRAMRNAPHAVQGAAGWAAELGWTGECLASRCRRHFHASPSTLLQRARIDRACELLRGGSDAVGAGLEVGYEATSAFYEAFRRGTGMTPHGYAILGRSPTFAVDLPPGYDTANWAAYVGRDTDSPSERVEGSRVLLGAQIGVPALLDVHLGPVVTCTVIGTDAPEHRYAAHARLVRMLGLRQPLAGFEKHLDEHPARGRLLPDGRARPIPQTGDVVEGLVWSIVGQQVTVPFASTLRGRLTREFGTPVGQGVTAPTGLAALADLEPAQLRPLQYSSRKAEYLVGAARAAMAGDLDLDALPLGSATGAERSLLALRGFGPWATNYLLMRACGFADCTPLGDTGLSMALWRVLDLPERPGPAEVARAMADFAPYRSLATYHLWRSLAHSETAG